MDERTGKMRDFLFTWRGSSPTPDSLNDLIAKICQIADVPRTTTHQFRHTLAVQWRKNGTKIETISRVLGHKSLRMTMRYVAVMPDTLRREFDQAFAAIDDEHRITAQVRAVLSPEAHLAAANAWRESLWVDLGIGWCGLSAFLPCNNRLACLPCPNYVEKREQLPLFQEQRHHLIELRMLGDDTLPVDRTDEIAGAVKALDQRIIAMGGTLHQTPSASPRDERTAAGDQLATTEYHVRQHDRLACPRRSVRGSITSPAPERTWGVLVRLPSFG